MNNLKRRLSRKFFIQYVIAMMLWFVASILLTLFGIIVVANVTWYPGLIWSFITLVRDYFPFFYLLFLFTGILILTYYFFRRPLDYLNELTDATQYLLERPQDALVLSEDLKVIQDRLNALRTDFLHSQAAAQEANQRKNNLIMYLAHDLKTPLTSVIGYLSLLHDEKDISDQTKQHYQDVALQKAYRLEELINEFFDITRFNLSAMEYDNAIVNMNRLIEQLVFEFQPMLDQHGLTITTTMDEGINVNGDGNKLSRVLDNVLKNAVNYCDDDSTITLTMVKDGHDMKLTCINTGQTIDASKLSRLFDPFFRADASRASRSGGAGLGLAICKEIINHYGGTITADSHDHQFILTITLPLANDCTATQTITN